jgi:hypothetical protein
MPLDPERTAFLDNYWRLLEARFHTGRISVAELIDRTQDSTFGQVDMAYPTPQEADAIGAARRTFYIGLVERLSGPVHKCVTG